MIPDASHIAQAAKTDEMIMREVDISLNVENGWATCGRFRTYGDDEDDGTHMQGYWVCYAEESEDAKWVMNLAVTQQPSDLYFAIEDIGLDDQRFTDSLNYIIFGSNDADVIAAIKRGEEE